MIFLNKEISFEDEKQNTLKFLYSVLKCKYENCYIYNFCIKNLKSKSNDESILIEGVTNCPKTAQDIFEKLVEFKVTPITLIDILDDYFNEISSLL